MKKYLSTDDEVRVVEMRKDGFSPKYIMDFFQIKKHHYYNIISRDGNPKNIPNKIYYQDNSYFSIIDNSSKAYWLGFIFADGYLRDGQLSIGLSSKDRDHLFRFKQSVNYTGDIKDKVVVKSFKGVKKRYFSSTIDIYSKQMCDDLMRYGLHTKKSLTLLPPTNLPVEYISHFIRGYFDGDGCISKYQSGGKSHKKIKILGTLDFLNWINNRFSESGISYRKIDNQTNKIFRIQYNTRDSYKIYNYLYNESEVHLERKKEKFNS